MLLYCFKCRKNTEKKNAWTKKGTVMFLSKCAVFDNRKSKFMKQQEATGSLSSLGIKATLVKIPSVGPLLLN